MNKLCQKVINSQIKGTLLTTREIFTHLWARYDKLAVNKAGKKLAAQKKRNFGRAFTNAVKNGEYKNIIYIGKNKQKASLFLVQ